MQILDDGRVTDSQGRVVSFKNTIIIMTSNLGSAAVLEVYGDKQQVSLAYFGACVDVALAAAGKAVSCDVWTGRQGRGLCSSWGFC